MSYCINLHSHSFLSDGALLPSEVAVRYGAAGYKVVAITDHADYSNIDTIIKAITDFTRHWPKNSPITVLPGIELTHLPPAQFSPLSRYARKHGIKIIVAHGETVVEPVVKGTNLAALEADIDILAHPGKISENEVTLAGKRGIFLEITSRKGHSQTNGYVAKLSLKVGAKLILDTDSHMPNDIISPLRLVHIGIKAGLSHKNIEKIRQDVNRFLRLSA